MGSNPLCRVGTVGFLRVVRLWGVILSEPPIASPNETSNPAVKLKTGFQCNLRLNLANRTLATELWDLEKIPLNAGTFN